MKKIKKYLEEIEKKFKTGHAREHAYRPALESLLEDINPSINAVNDPKQQKVGAPDFVLFKGKVSIGYVEAKDVDVDLDREIKNKNQVNRYKASLNNFCFTNYLEFRFYLNGEETERVEIAKLDGEKIETYPENFELLESLLKNFTTQKSISIKSPKELAKLMAEKAKMLKNTLYLSLKDKEEEGEVEKQYEVFKEILINDLSQEQFADIYAQTVAYGMFAARYHDPTLDTFTRNEANELLPKSNPFLRNFFQSIAGYNIDSRIVWIVDDLAELFNHVDVKELLKNYGKETKRHDAIVHFYETFLGEFDAKMRKSRGVYYTPEPVVDFIVRAVDDILKDEFNIKDGLADTEKIEVLEEEVGKQKRKRVKEHRVQILDPATGTGTFLDRTIKHIYNSKFKGQEGLWQTYVDEHLLPRLHGFEILMASYAMAHLKLDITLSETGYDFKKGAGKRLGVYLTNSLAEPTKLNRDLFSQWLSTESVEANKIKKEKPIMVVMGNPPYSVSSSNASKDDQGNNTWIGELIEEYKKELNEKKINLDDDYIKFIRYAQWFIEKNGEGVVAFITNNSFLDGITHRQMRKSLLESFDKIYILNLHGNSLKKEKTPGGGKDENVFDIRQGVSINIFVKKSGSHTPLAEIFYTDIFGRRKEKYKILEQKNLSEIKWKMVEPEEEQYFLTYRVKSYNEYLGYCSLTDLFPLKNSGIQTKCDELSISVDPEVLEETINNFKKLPIESLQRKYDKKETSGWNYKRAKRDIQETDILEICPYNYRPFDFRHVIYTGHSSGFVGRSRSRVMKHFVGKENLGLALMRQFFQDTDFSHVYISNTLIDERTMYSNRGGTYLFPLYIYKDGEDQKTISREFINPNLSEKELDVIVEKLNLQYLPDHKHPDAGKKGTFNPLNVLDYIYAILHNPTYRERYKEFLKIDFPRIPFTSDKKLFWKLVKKGRELREYHLMEHEKSNKLITKFPVSGSNEITRRLTKTNIGFELTDKEKKTGRVWINDEQYFDKVPRLAWNFYIGGYQPAQKWLKDRRDRKLTYEEIEHYQKIIVALVNTDRLMEEIDEVVEEWPIK
jgi:predicted helicase